MLEYIIYRKERLRPFLFFLSGVFYTIISGAISLILFPAHASVSHVLLSSLATAPLMFRAVSRGAKILSSYPDRVGYVQLSLIVVYVYFLIGTIVGYLTSYFIWGEKLFYIQKDEINAIRGAFAGGDKILSNNLTVYLIGTLLSFIYGTGGVLLINWNGSLIGYMLYLEMHSGNPIGLLLGILPHGIFEFLGYFMGGISGVMIGVSIIQRGWSAPLIRDTIIFFGTGIIFIVIGAFIESLLLSLSL